MENLIKQTKEIINSGSTVYKIIKEIVSLKSDISLRKTSKPLLNTNSPTIDEINIYQKNLAKYEEDVEFNNSNRNEINKFISKKDEILKEYIIDESNLKSIPIEYQEKVYNYAKNKLGGDWYCLYLEIDELVENVF